MDLTAEAKTYLEKIQDLNLQVRGIVPLSEEELRQRLRGLAVTWSALLEEDTTGFRGFAIDNRQVHEDLLARAADLSNLPSRYQDPFVWQWLVVLGHQIDEAVHRFGLEVQSPLVASMPMGEPNAMTLPIPNTEQRLVIFDDELMTFAWLLSKVVVRIVGPQLQRPRGLALRPLFTRRPKGNSLRSGENDVLSRLRAEPDIIKRFVEVLVASVAVRNTSAAPPYLLPPDQMEQATAIATSMELFVLGHEYGHIMRHHVGQVRNLSAGHREDVKHINWTWDEEFEADSVGVLLAGRAMRDMGSDPTIAYCGPDYFLSCADLMDRVSMLIETGQEKVQEKVQASSSHPPNSDRRERLRSTIAGLVDQSEASAVSGFGRQLELAIETLWETVKPQLVEDLANDRVPRRKWFVDLPPDTI
jgi:hypothetical protein